MASQGRCFTRAEAIEVGLSVKQLRHPRFVQVFPGGYHEAAHIPDRCELIEAARLVLPDDARLSHTSRFVPLGLDCRTHDPLHFTVARDHHLAIPGVVLHRTVLMPSNDGAHVDVPAAVIQSASLVRLIDVVAICDWLVRSGHATVEAVVAAAAEELWRPGTRAALDAAALCDPRAESLPESRLRAMLVCAGLPTPEVNFEIRDGGELVARSDLAFVEWRLLAEYEGRQHALDARQFARDIDRYGALRALGWDYVQVTHEMLARPRSVVALVHQRLVARGYRGGGPSFGPKFRTLVASPGRPGWSVR